MMGGVPWRSHLTFASTGRDTRAPGWFRGGRKSLLSLLFASPFLLLCKDRVKTPPPPSRKKWQLPLRPSEGAFERVSPSFRTKAGVRASPRAGGQESTRPVPGERKKHTPRVTRESEKGGKHQSSWRWAFLDFSFKKKKRKKFFKL